VHYTYIAITDKYFVSTDHNVYNFITIPIKFTICCNNNRWGWYMRRIRIACDRYLKIKNHNNRMACEIGIFLVFYLELRVALTFNNNLHSYFQGFLLYCLIGFIVIRDIYIMYTYKANASWFLIQLYCTRVGHTYQLLRYYIVLYWHTLKKERWETMDKENCILSNVIVDK